MNKNIDNVLIKLSMSKFRSSFYLEEKDIIYVNSKGLNQIRKHANDFITKRLAPKDILNDGKQTPYRGHPVFIAQHATGTCCRDCLYKWHHIPKNKELTQEEKEYIVDFIMIWIRKQLQIKRYNYRK